MITIDDMKRERKNIVDINTLLASEKKVRSTFISAGIDRDKEILRLKKEQNDAEEAQVIIQAVAQQTQKELEYKISEIVTLALATVFEEPYNFKIDFVIRRGKTEADIKFVKTINGVEEIFDPMTESGGGAVDVASFALRLAAWNLQRPLTRRTIILDEPFRFLSKDLQPKAGELLKTLSNKLKIQFIMVTHNHDLIEASDKVFAVRKEKGISRVNEVAR